MPVSKHMPIKHKKPRHGPQAHLKESSTKKHIFLRELKRGIFLTLGAFFVAIGLEIFLIPNTIIDGGIIGIAIILSHLSKLPLGIFTLVLNLPFLFIGYQQIGKTFALSTLYSVACLSLFVNYLHPVPQITNDLLLAAVFGGIVLGLGVGTIIRYNGSLDGTEIVAIIISRTLGFSVGEIVMFFNIFIMSSAGFVFGWDKAMYSLIAYFVAFKVIDVVLEGIDESKSVTIISDYPEILADAIISRLGRGVTYIQGRGAYTGNRKMIIYCVVTRLELSKLRSIVQELDPGAFVAVEHVYDVMGGRFKKKSIHP